MRAVCLTADGFEDLELFVPWYRLAEADWALALATPRGRPATGRHGYSVPADLAVHAVNPVEFDLLLIPGGAAPEELRQSEAAVAVARAFADDERPIATVGRGPQLLLSAGVLSGRAITCSRAIRDDVLAAGAKYRDEPAVRDGFLVSGRSHTDLPALCRLMLT